MALILASTANPIRIASLSRAAAGLGCEVRLVATTELSQHSRRPVPEVAAVVYETFRLCEVDVALLRNLRRAHPHVPVLMVTSAYRDRLSLECSALDALGIAIHVPAPDSSGDDGIETALRIVLEHAPGKEVDRFVEKLLGHHCPLALAYAKTITRLLPDNAAVDHSPSVDAIANEIGTSSRTLSRQFRDSGLPTPLLLLDGVMLLWIARTGAHGGRDAREVCRRFAINEERMRRTLRRLSGATKFPPPGQFYVEVVIAFAHACGVGHDAAMEAVQESA